jgi:hypothetical protein
MKLPSRRPSPALMISIIALFVALGGTSVAAFKLKANSVKTRAIKDGAVTTPKLASGATIDNANNAANAKNATSANSANNANHAGTADAFTDGTTPGDLVFGHGFQFAGAQIPDDGQDSGLQFTGEGILNVACSATPDLSWQNDNDDQGTPVTDIWLDSSNPTAHTLVPDGTASTGLVSNIPDLSTNVTIWTGDDAIFNVHVSVFWDVTNTECSVVFFSNGEPNSFQINANGASKSGPDRPTLSAPRLVGDGRSK